MSGSNPLSFGVPTIASSGAPRVVNPLAAITAGNQAAQAEYDLRAKQAKEAAGQAFQQAINPQTGELDVNEFRKRLAARGPAALAAGEELTRVQAIGSNQLEQARAKAAWVNAQAGAALQTGDFSDAAMMRIFQNGLASGLLTMPEVQRQIQIIPSDPEGRRRWLQEHQDSSATVEQQYEQRFGKRQAVGAGGRTEFVTVPPARSNQPGPVVMHSLTPAELDAAAEMPDMRRTLPDGSPNPNYQAMIATTVRQKLIAQGYTIGSDGQIYPPGQKPPGGAAPTVNFGTGRQVSPALVGPGGVPPAGGGQGAGGAAAPAAAAPAAPGASLVSKPPPADTKLAEASGPQFTTEINNANVVPQRKAILANMLADSRRFSGGTGADMQKEWKRLLLTWSPYLTSAYTGITKDSVEAQESFDKLAAQILQQQQTGAGSDFRMGIDIKATPQASLTPQGRELLLAQLAGNEDYLAARATLANKWPAKSDFAGYQQHVKELDPRVFQYEAMTTEQGRKWFLSLDEKTQREIMKAHQWAKDQGLLGVRR